MPQEKKESDVCYLGCFSVFRQTGVMIAMYKRLTAELKITLQSTSYSKFGYRFIMQ